MIIIGTLVHSHHFSPWLPASSYCSQRQFIHLINYQENGTKNVPAHLTTSRSSDGGFTYLSHLMASRERGNDTVAVRRLVVDYLWESLIDI
ncbi:unnamed protein product [Adineta ricciae]|uniref:Uncharacterized protein n=1 Tax=Adineta ricciae TaxID=249248 RepID=A0A815D4L2_ADIRI|nr:unnamed protein product [Adineta ricciae]